MEKIQEFNQKSADNKNNIGEILIKYVLPVPLACLFFQLGILPCLPEKLFEKLFEKYLIPLITVEGVCCISSCVIVIIAFSLYFSLPIEFTLDQIKVVETAENTLVFCFIPKKLPIKKLISDLNKRLELIFQSEQLQVEEV